MVCCSQEVPKAPELRASTRERGSVCVADILEGSKSPQTQFWELGPSPGQKPVFWVPGIMSLCAAEDAPCVCREEMAGD